MFFIKILKWLKKNALQIVFLGALSCGVFVLDLPDGKFHLYFFDVGQGDSVFIKTPENKHILIDGGPNNAVSKELSDTMSFFDRTIDLMVLTHPHLDHVKGLINVLKSYDIKRVMATFVIYKSTGYTDFLKAVKDEGAEIFVADSLTDFDFGDVFVDTLYPFSKINGQTFKDVNDSSIAMKIIYKDKAVFVGGDIGKSIEKKISEKYSDIKSDVLKISHHGSKNSSSDAFIKDVSPKIAVISCGKNNSYHFPTDIVLDTLKKYGVKIYQTDLDGKVEIVF
ncbi:MBL fold metallo-hydrolase [Candidatus Gracilibacteria bacterium]|nr:MBL fold metallo-hydrolase [Candidatus Gracilibacteria bacterium]